DRVAAPHLHTDSELVRALALFERRARPRQRFLVGLGLFLFGLGPVLHVFLPRLAGDGVHEYRADDLTLADLGDEVVGQVLAIDDFRMLDAVDAGIDGKAETFWAGRVRLDHLAARVRSIDERFLRFRRESDERRLREMTRAAVLDEVRTFVDVGVDRAREFGR